MSINFSSRGKNLILGALVADAASMGLHWIYDQDRIAQIAGDTPEFHEPKPENYADTAGYFAHGHLQAGDQSQYGAQLTTLLHSLSPTGEFDHRAYAKTFRETFGYGGAYVGYIDRPTRDTLDNYRRAQEQALHRAQSLHFDGDDNVTAAMITKATSLVGDSSGNALRKAFIEAVRITHGDDDAVMAHGLAILAEISSAQDTTGADDHQLPAISKLPPLIAALEYTGGLGDFTAIDRAVRVTNDNPTAIAGGRIAAAMMIAALNHDDLAHIVSQGRAHATPDFVTLIDEAIAMGDQSPQHATKHFGMACYLNHGLPSAIHTILSSRTYVEAVRSNIRSGGDTCGRSILIGAIAGAVFGVGGDCGIPTDWIEKIKPVF